MIDLSKFEVLYTNMRGGTTVGTYDAFFGKDAMLDISRMVAYPKYLVTRKNGMYSIVASLKLLQEKNLPLAKALWCVLNMKRKKMLGYCGPGAIRRYGELVPFYLSAYKEYLCIPYNSWLISTRPEHLNSMNSAFGEKLWNEIRIANPIDKNPNRTHGYPEYYNNDYLVPNLEDFNILKKEYLAGILNPLDRPTKGLRYNLTEEIETTGEDTYDGQAGIEEVNRYYTCKRLNTACLTETYEAHHKLRTPYTLLNLSFRNFDHNKECMPTEEIRNNPIKEELFTF